MISKNGKTFIAVVVVFMSAAISCLALRLVIRSSKHALNIDDYVLTFALFMVCLNNTGGLLRTHNDLSSLKLKSCPTPFVELKRVSHSDDSHDSCLERRARISRGHALPLTAKLVP